MERENIQRLNLKSQMKHASKSELLIIAWSTFIYVVLSASLFLYGCSRTPPPTIARKAKPGEPVQWKLAEPGEEINVIYFSPDNKIAAGSTKDGIVKLWDTQTGTLIRTLEGHHERHNERVESMIFYPDGKTLATVSYGTIKLWDTDTWQTKQTIVTEIEYDRLFGFSLAISPDGNILAAAATAISQKTRKTNPLERLFVMSGNGNITLFDAHTGILVKRLKNQQPNGAIAFSPDGKLLANAGYSDIDIIDVNKGKILKMQGDYVSSLENAVVFSPNGKLLANLTRGDETISVWDIEKKALQKRLFNCDDDPLSDGNVLSVAFSPDSRIVVAGSKNRAVGVWDAKTGEGKVTKLEGDVTLSTSSIVFSDKQMTLMGYGAGKLVIYDISNLLR